MLAGLTASLAPGLTTAHAKEWRGIVPLHSTRADVSRLLGKPNFNYNLYEFGDERADILYARHACSEGGAWNVAPDTVTEIHVVRKSRHGHLRCPNLHPPLTCEANYDGCPVVEVESLGALCPGPKDILSVFVSGVAPEDTLTYSWTVSAGKIISGHGTSAVTVDASGSGDKPVTATVTVAFKLCEFCTTGKSYTIQPCPGSKPAKGGKRRQYLKR